MLPETQRETRFEQLQRLQPAFNEQYNELIYKFRYIYIYTTQQQHLFIF